RAEVYENLSKSQKLMITFMENEVRKNASPLYQAQMLNGIKEEEDLTQTQLEERVGMDQSTISQYLSLLQLSPEIFKNIGRLIKLGVSHFMQISRLDNK